MPKDGNQNSLPVMFWISGGGFIAGSGGISAYGPQYLLDKDIVLVTINYRIGILGKRFELYLYKYNLFNNLIIILSMYLFVSLKVF